MPKYYFEIEIQAPDNTNANFREEVYADEKLCDIFSDAFQYRCSLQRKHLIKHVCDEKCEVYKYFEKKIKDISVFMHGASYKFLRKES